MYLYFMSFLHIDMTRVVGILPQIRQELTYSTVSIMGADVLAMQGASASTTIWWQVNIGSGNGP